MKVSSCKNYRQCGFTLVELIMVIALAGIVAVMISTVMSRPLQGFADQSRRAELTDLAAMALNRMARDIRLAVPNSVLIKGDGIYFVPIEAAGRYGTNPDPAGVMTEPLVCPPSPSVCSIKILSRIEPDTSTDKHWLIIYNTNTPIERLIDGEIDVVSPKEFTWTSKELNASLDGFKFSSHSSQHRFYLAKQVVGYRCDSDGFLWRETFERLDLTEKSSSAKVVNSIPASGCNFTYASGANARNGLVTLRLTLKDKDTQEAVTLLQQVHVDNAP
ncbi:MAG: type II secretion system protein [Pseudomonas stutzeri]|nr:type II secretion system protein [Stutzerimonas stutzeri]